MDHTTPPPFNMRKVIRCPECGIKAYPDKKEPTLCFACATDQRKHIAIQQRKASNAVA